MIRTKLFYMPHLQQPYLWCRAVLLALLGSMLAIPCTALPNDRQQPISIESDYAERNEKTGRTVYRGNVVISQGSVLIEADQITLHVEKNKISRIECTGKPASYQQKPTLESATMIARADHIDYLPATKKLALKQNAMLSRNGTIIKGDSIDYDIDKQTWKAKGNNQGQQKRIQLVIPASALQSDSNKPETKP
ncbi:lipopolysaccharide transport periplasmic protein LptA [Porticoccaceae bacterium]|nr:lipopolysaccharide transport periplasmic protein LptA [Porticoccaceae bacterium]